MRPESSCAAPITAALLLSVPCTVSGLISASGGEYDGIPREAQPWAHCLLKLCSAVTACNMNQSDILIEF